jgi:NAD(P)-dependent dehydrogenase (short-subunit alcohol dehydrogenase family)
MAVVLITGGSSGIGLATVRRLAASGHRVFYASRGAAEDVPPGEVLHIGLDPADPGACDAAIASVVAAAGCLDVLVNNAGTVSLAPLEEATDAEAHRIFEVNVFGPMRLARAALPVMRAQGSGKIINVTSGNDIAPAPFGGWYSASKAAFASLSTVLNAELHGSGISVTVIAPGLFRTSMPEQFRDSRVNEGSPYAKAFAAIRNGNGAIMERAGDPDQVARAIEDCMRASAPPMRIVVGADAVEMEAEARRSSPQEYADLLRDYVAGLSA